MATNSDVPRIVNALIGVESGGRFDALGPVITNPKSRYYGDRAYGVSQIMGRNIPSWTQKYLGREMTPKEFLADRSAQLAVTQGFVNEHLSKGLTPDQVANVWFTGSATPNLNVSDELGTSAAEYRRRFNERFGSAADRVENQMGGLIGNMGQGQPQPQPQPQPQGGMFRNPDFWESLALASNTLRLEPDQGLAQQIGQRREARAAQQGVNRTVEYFASQGMNDLAQLAQIDPAGAMRLFIERQQGPQAPSPESAAGKIVADYRAGLIDEATMRRALDAIGAPSTVINTANQGSAITEEGAKLIARQFGEIVEQGNTAGRNLGTLLALDMALQEAPQGFAGALISAAGEFGIPMEGLDAVQAAEALLNQLTPAQRPPGSGTMSDRDIAMFKASLPRLINQPGGNKRILDTMRAMIEYDQQRGIIAQNALFGRITPEQAFEEYNALANPLAWVRTFGGGERTNTVAPSETGGGAVPDFSTWTTDQLRDFIRERGGNP